MVDDFSIDLMRKTCVGEILFCDSYQFVFLCCETVNTGNHAAIGIAADDVQLFEQKRASSECSITVPTHTR